MTTKEERITFVAKVSRSGNRRLINIPADVREDVPEKYYKVYLIPIKFKDL